MPKRAPKVLARDVLGKARVNMETLMIYCRTCEAWIDAEVFPACHKQDGRLALERMWELPARE